MRRILRNVKLKSGMKMRLVNVLKNKQRPNANAQSRSKEMRKNGKIYLEDDVF
jgi:ATP phosphoribosyltransferase regulatory subunit HisZ